MGREEITFRAGRSTYKVCLRTMRQTNIRTNYVRPVIRVVREEEEEEEEEEEGREEVGIEEEDWERGRNPFLKWEFNGVEVGFFFFFFRVISFLL